MFALSALFALIACTFISQLVLSFVCLVVSLFECLFDIFVRLFFVCLFVFCRFVYSRV